MSKDDNFGYIGIKATLKVECERAQFTDEEKKTRKISLNRILTHFVICRQISIKKHNADQLNYEKIYKLLLNNGLFNYFF